MRSWRLWLAVAFALLVLTFCLMGWMQAIWLGATPGFPLERANRNVAVFGSGAIVCAVAVIVLGLKLYKRRK